MRRQERSSAIGIFAAAAAFVACGAPAQPTAAAPLDGDEQAATAASAVPFVHLTFESATIAPDFSLVDHGTTYARVVNGDPLPPRFVELTPAAEGRRAIAYQVPEGTEKERIEHKLSRFDDPNGLHFGTTRYTSFAFMLDAQAARIDSSMLFFQEWQGYPHGPPVALKLTKGDAPPFAVRLAVRNMDTGPDSATPDLVVWTGSLAPGEWHRFVVMVKPSHGAPIGEVKLWMDGVRVADWTGKIGYDPVAIGGALDGFDTKLGLYQPSPNVGHTVYFDDVRFASTFAAANPAGR